MCSLIYYPQGNSETKASNKNLLKILHRTVNKLGKDWHLQLNPKLWAYHNNIRTPTRATPFTLVYSTKVFFSIEVELPFLSLFTPTDT